MRRVEPEPYLALYVEYLVRLRRNDGVQHTASRRRVQPAEDQADGSHNALAPRHLHKHRNSLHTNPRLAATNTRSLPPPHITPQPC